MVLTVFRRGVPSADGGKIVQQIPSLRLIHLSEELKGRLRDVHRTPEISFERRPRVRFHDTLDFADDRIPGGIERIIDPAEFDLHLLEGGSDFFGFGYVEFDDQEVS